MTSKAFGLAQLGDAYSDGALSNRNKIINGAMVIDQRNAGAAVTPTSSTYTLDRWRLGASVASKVSVQQSTVAPVGFTNSTLITSLSAYTMAGEEEINFGQRIEGFNAADLGWGTANAKPVTFSFWVRSSLTGLFSGAIKSFDSLRSYVFSYNINAADTWEYKIITVAGDTTGTWKTDNGIGVIAQFCIGNASKLNTAGVWYAANTVGATGTTQLVGTNGATFYITGVQLEAGDTATPFEHRSYGDELLRCQRYYQEMGYTGQSFERFGSGFLPDAGTASYYVQYRVEKRASPTVTVSDVNHFFVYTASGNKTATSYGATDISRESVNLNFFVSGVTAGQGTLLIRDVSDPARIYINAEL